MRLSVLLVLLSLGCAPNERRWRAGVSLPVNAGIAESITTGSGGMDIEVARAVTGLLWEFQYEDAKRLDLGVQSSVTLITSGTKGGPGLGGELFLRPRLDMGWWEPYVIASVGFEYYINGIEGQGTDWGFPLSGGFGTRFEVCEETWVSVDLTLWHTSNGASIFQHDQTPNPGWNTDLLSVAIETSF